MQIDLNELRKIPEKSLLQNTAEVVAQERRISVKVLWHLQEVERRKAYVALGFLSLFEYAVSELKYSEASAMRRIQAMRALRELPELSEKIQAGSITVSGAARVQSFIRKDEKISGERWSVEEKSDLFKTLENSSQAKLEATLVEISPRAAVVETKKTIQGGLTEIKIHLTSAEIKEIEETRNLLAHGLKDPGSWSEFILKLTRQAREEFKQNKLGSKRRKELRTVSPMTEPKPAISPMVDLAQEDLLLAKQESLRPQKREQKNTFLKPQSRFIPVGIKRKIFERADFRCENRDPVTGARCNSNFKLEIDHRIPFALGGSSEIENLQLLCRGHNVARTRQL